MRNFFIKLAKKKGFDPFNPGNWYSLRWKDFLVKEVRIISMILDSLSYLFFQGGSYVLQKFKSVSAALVHLFPDVKFEKQKFNKPSMLIAQFLNPLAPIYSLNC